MNQEYLRIISRLISLKPKFLQSSMRLAKLRSVLGNFDNPELALNKYIHVGGTNGKGSVSMKIAKGLELSGYKTGLFTSPHLFSYTERIKINSSPVPVARFIQIYNKVSPYIYQYQLNYFQVATLMAFVYYHEQNCDKIVMEVGVGGTLDSTNVIQNPIISVMTSIGLDHIELLGDSLHSIAKNKAGIIKEGRPAVIGLNCFPESVFEERANLLKSKLSQPELKKYDSFQKENNALVSKVFEVLEQTEGIKLTFEAKQQALKSKQECRKQYIPHNLLPISNQKKQNQVILDVGHNPPALKKLFQTLKQQHPDRNFIIIYGTSGHKDSGSTTNVLKTFTDRLFFIQAKHFRAMVLSQLKRNALGVENIQIIQNGDIEKTITHVLDHSENKDIIVICGSFFIMGEAKGYFYPQQIGARLDPPVIPLQELNKK